MPYEPTFPQPYLSAIDISLDEGSNFQCVINPRDEIIAYKITIKKIEDSETVCVVRGLINEGVQEKYYKDGGSAEVQITDIPDSDTTLPARGRANSDDSILVVNIPKMSSLTNGCEYFWTIELTAPNNTDANDTSNTVKSKDFYFTTAKNPEITMPQLSILESNRLEVAIPYSQEQNLLPAYYRFNLYNKAKEVYTTDDVFSSNIVFEYDKFVNGEDYELELIVVLDNGITSVSQCDFSVSYTEATELLLSTTETDAESTCIVIDYSQQINMNGLIEGKDTLTFLRARNSGESYTDSPNILCMDKNQNIYWEKVGNESLNLEDVTHIIHWHPHDNFDGTIVEIEDQTDAGRRVSLSLSDGIFCYTNGYSNSINYYLYDGEASAIAGNDEHSAKGLVTGCSSDKTVTNITLDITKQDKMAITPGMIISFDSKEAVIESVSDNIISVATDSFSYIPTVGEICSIYKDNYRYVLADDDFLTEDDVLVWNNLTPTGWYYIIIAPYWIKLIKDTNTIEIEEVR